MKENIIREKSFEFAIEIVKTYNYLVKQKNEYVLSKQLLKAGTSVGAMVRESEFAQSKSDFINKLSIGIKECNESLYWLDLLKRVDYLDSQRHMKIKNLVVENLKILTSIIISSKKSINRKVQN